MRPTGLRRKLVMTVMVAVKYRIYITTGNLMKTSSRFMVRGPVRVADDDLFIGASAAAVT